jgi:hypothetical protein
MLLKNSHALLLEFIIAIAALGAVATQFFFFMQDSSAASQTTLGAVVGFFSYFTILTNLLVAVTLLGRIWARFAPQRVLRERWFDVSVASACAVYIVLVGIVYEMLLRELRTFTGAAAVANFVLHDFVPIMYVLYWLGCVRKGHLSVGNIVGWLVFPLVYASWVLARGAYTGRYPYPFLNAHQFGYLRVAANCVMLTVSIAAAGLLIVSVDRMLARLRIGT